MSNHSDETERSQARRQAREHQLQLIAETAGHNLPTFLDEEGYMDEDEVVELSPPSPPAAGGGAFSPPPSAFEFAKTDGGHPDDAAPPPPGTAQEFHWDGAAAPPSASEEMEAGERTGATAERAWDNEGNFYRPRDDKSYDHHGRVPAAAAAGGPDPVAAAGGAGPAAAAPNPAPSVYGLYGGGRGLYSHLPTPPGSRGRPPPRGEGIGSRLRGLSLGRSRRGAPPDAVIGGPGARHTSAGGGGGPGAATPGPARHSPARGVPGGPGGIGGPGARRGVPSSMEVERGTHAKSGRYPDEDYTHDGTFAGGDRFDAYDSYTHQTKTRVSWACTVFCANVAACCSLCYAVLSARESLCCLAMLFLVALVSVSVTESDKVEPMVSGPPLDFARLEAIAKRVVNAGASTEGELEATDPTGPQKLALEWLAWHDPRSVDPGDEFLLQRYGLAVFWFGTHDNDVDEPREERERDGWKMSDGWMTERGFCSWHGIKCQNRRGTPNTETTYDDDGVVTHLVLERLIPGGVLPREVFTCLTDLHVLDLHDNDLGGSLPTEMGDLKKLTLLNLGSNKLQGNIPTSVGGLRLLSTLDLSDNLLTGPFPKEVKDLSDTLMECKLFKNDLTGTLPEGLGDLTLLHALNLDSNRLRGPIPTTIGHLTRLADLRLRNNELTGQIPEQIGLMTSLEFLFLDTNPMSGTLPPELSSLVRLEELHVHNCGLKGTLPSELGTLHTLRDVYLDGNEFTGTLPESYNRWYKVQHLYLNSNRLSGPIPDKFGFMEDLRILSLRGNEFTGTIPSQLGLLRVLTQLSLEDNNLRGTVPTELGILMSLGTLLLHGNHLTGTIPDQICDRILGKSLKRLSAQCKEVKCDCCTECF